MNWEELGKQAHKFYERVRWSDAVTPAYVQFKPLRVDVGATLQPFDLDKTYFRIIINEMYLSHARQWTSDYDPVVFAATEFEYGMTVHSVPRVIGPSLLQPYLDSRPVPQASRYLNTPVSGLHPYVGGDVAIIVILYRIKRVDHLQNLLAIVEKIAGLANPSIALDRYMGVAGVIEEGLDLILGTGDAQPVVAARYQTGPYKKFGPGYHVLIDAPETSINPEQLWIRDDRLCIGDSLDTAVPYRDHDFVLFSVAQENERSDIQTLPFFPLWRQVQETAIKPDQDAWEQAKGSFRVLWRDLLFSPDLTTPQKDQLKQNFQSEMKRLREEAKGLDTMGVEKRGPAASEIDNDLHELNRILSELE